MSIDKLKQDLQESKEQLAAKINFFEKYKDDMELLMVSLEPLGTSFIDTKLNHNDVDISVTGTRTTMNTLVGTLRKLGYVANRTPVEGDTSYCTYFYQGDTDFRVWVNFTSTVCRRVKIGTEMREVDVYEVQCDDEEEPLPEVTLGPGYDGESDVVFPD